MNNRPPTREPIKFDGDFDFESANAKFDKDELEKELKKLTISKFYRASQCNNEINLFLENSNDLIVKLVVFRAATSPEY